MDLCPWQQAALDDLPTLSPTRGRVWIKPVPLPVSKSAFKAAFLRYIDALPDLLPIPTETDGSGDEQPPPPPP